MGSKYFRADAEVRMYVDELIREYHDHLLTAKFGLLFQEHAPKSKGKLQFASVCLFPAKFQAFFPEEEFDYLLTVSCDIWNRAWLEQKRAIIDHELCHCWGEEDEETGEMAWSVVGHDCEVFSSELIRHGAWHKDLELARQAFQMARPMGALPDLSWQAPSKKRSKESAPEYDHRQLDIEVEISKAGPKKEAVQVAGKLITTLGTIDEQAALDLIHAGLDVVGDNKKTLDLFEAVEKACHSRPRVLAEIARLRTMLAEPKPAEPPAAEAAPAPEPAPGSAPTPLAVDCSRCGVVAGEPCRDMKKGKHQGKPLADGTYHDERIEALASAEPTSESWGDEIEDDEEVG